jgi:antitoxin component YwqK of YwqJK toxin-antitoxin module
MGHVETDFIDGLGNRHWNGAMKGYYDDGRIRLLGKYKDNIQIGPWKYYDKKGDLDSILTYDKNGNVVKKQL